MNLLVALFLSVASVIWVIAIFACTLKKILGKQENHGKTGTVLRNIKNFFIKLFCALWITTVWLASVMSYAEGGAEINGLLAFLIWVISLLVLLKVNAIVSAVGSLALLEGIRVIKFGFQDVMLYGIGIVVVLFGGIFLFFKLIESGGRKNISRRNISEKQKQQRPKQQWREQWSFDYGYDGIEKEKPEVREMRSEEDKEFYNIKSRDNTSDCPYIYHKSSNGGQEPYYCGFGRCQISFDTYYHLCRYEWVAKEKCPYGYR